MAAGKMVISEILRCDLVKKQSIISMSKNNVAYTCNNDIYHITG